MSHRAISNRALWAGVSYLAVCLAAAAPLAAQDIFEDFNDNALPATFEITGTDVGFSGGAAIFDGHPVSGESNEARRSYLRTVSDDLFGRSFVAEVTLVQGSDIAFFGIGGGSPTAFYNEPAGILLRMHPSSIAGGGTAWADTNPNGSGQAYGNMGVVGDGTHRLRLTWDAVSQTAVFEIDKYYAGGSMVPDVTSTAIDGSNNGFTDSNTRFFFGSSAMSAWQASKPAVFDDVVVRFADTDTDGDGLLDADENAVYGTDPTDPDTDDDGLSDGDEVNTYGTNPLASDTDGDGLTDGDEIAAQQFGCPDPQVADTDMDGLDDGLEAMLGLDACDDADFDGDGLMDAQEILIYGTDPADPDTDDDGLFDGTEVDMAQGGSCPDPRVLDSDGDSLSDGDEVLLGTMPCNVDTDGDSVPDNLDDLPTDPGVTTGYIEQNLRVLADDVNETGLANFSAPNDNAARGRRNAIGNKLKSAAAAIATGDLAEALSELESLLLKLDDDPSPPDWMTHEGAAPTSKDIVREDIELMIDLINLDL